MASNYHFLAVALGIVFCAIGIAKVVPLEPAHSAMKSDFRRYVTVFPLKDFTGYKPSAELYRTIAGVVEIAFGVLLAFGTFYWHRNACFVLLTLMSLAVYTVLALGEPPQNVLFPGVLGGLVLLLITRHGNYNL